MMIQLEMYWCYFPRAEEDMVEVDFEFPALNLVIPVLYRYSTSCSRAQACSVEAWSRGHLHLELIWHWWDSYKDGYFNSTVNLALLVLLSPGCSCLLSCYPGDTCCPVTYSPRRAESRDPESSRNCSHQNSLCMSSEMDTQPMWNSEAPEIKVNEPWCLLWEFYLLCSYPLVKQRQQEPPKEVEWYHAVILFLI